MFYSLDSNDQIHLHVFGKDYTIEDIVKMNTDQLLKFVHDCYLEGYEDGVTEAEIHNAKLYDCNSKT